MTFRPPIAECLSADQGCDWNDWIIQVLPMNVELWDPTQRCWERKPQRHPNIPKWFAAATTRPTDIPADGNGISHRTQ